MTSLEQPGISVVRLTQGKLPRLPFRRIKEAILGEGYDLSIAFVGLRRSEELHKEHKGKPGPANTLAFSLSDDSGEIIMSLATMRRQAGSFDMDMETYATFLLIHSMVHLLGYDHGDEMEKIEDTYRKQFKVPNPYKR